MTPESIFRGRLVAASVALTVILPGSAFAYGQNDAIRDCESHLRSEYGLSDFRHESAKDKGLLTAEQIYEVLAGAVTKISAGPKLKPEAKLVGSEADCTKMVAELQDAVKSQQQ